MAIKGEEERSRPWSADEFIRLNGFNLCYTTCKEGNKRVIDMVCFPGGELTYLESFLDRFPEARMPRRIMK